MTPQTVFVDNINPWTGEEDYPTLDLSTEVVQRVLVTTENLWCPKPEPTEG